MDGTTTVTTSGNFLRVFRARVVTAGSSETNEGTITMNHTTSGDLLAQISLTHWTWSNTNGFIYNTCR